MRPLRIRQIRGIAFPRHAPKLLPIPSFSTPSYIGSQYLIGDEGNEAEFGKLGSYVVVNGTLERTLGRLALFVRGHNLLNSKHNTFGIISPNVRGPNEEPQPFLTPGLPFRVQAGIRYRF